MKVFWSWQSDIPGKTGRHFVRSALKAAIEELRQPADVEEPSEREMKDRLHLDHDRQGVTGSPRLLETILTKIEAATVFVGDVTPVATIPAQGAGEDERSEKRIMNPNVAIELGYAIKAISELNILMVLNTHYGNRESLPFDLKGNAGPIMFDLPPDADGPRIRSEAAALRGQLVVALRPFLKAAALPQLVPVRTPQTTSPAVFFERGEVLASFGEERDLEECGFDTDQGVYFRMLPDVALPVPLTRPALRVVLNGSQLDSLSNNGLGIGTLNRYGAVYVERGSTENGTLKAGTQVFQNGEFWGFAPWLIEDRGYGKKLPLGGLERVIRRALPRYLNVAADLGLRPPFTLELGATGIEGFRIAVDSNPDTDLGPIYDNEVTVSVVLNDASPTAQQAALLKLFQGFCDVSGYPRPAVVNGFPS